VPTISQLAHDDAFGAGGTCLSCHVAVPAIGPATGHINGALAADDALTSTNEYYVLAAYTDAAGNGGACAGGAAPPAGVNAGCHDGGGDAGTWKRLWSTTAYLTDGTQCANCHGGMNQTDWTFGAASSTTDGSVEHERNWDGDATSGEVSGNHANLAGNGTKCNVCHVYADTPYTAMGWQPATTSTYHGNNSIDMNSTMNYNLNAWNCASHCHFNPSNTGHSLEDSVWTVNAVAGPMPSCAGCHGDGSSAYWPNGTAYPDRAGEHSAHLVDLAAKLGYTLPGNDTQQRHLCKYCHDSDGGTGHDTGGQPAEVPNFSRIWDTVNPPGATDLAPAGTFTTGGNGVVKYGGGTVASYYGCAGVACHGDYSGGNTANTPNWYNTVAAVGAALADGRCGTCHGTVATTNPMPVYADGAKGNKHAKHVTTNGYGCQVCHYGTTTNGTSIVATTLAASRMGPPSLPSSETPRAAARSGSSVTRTSSRVSSRPVRPRTSARIRATISLAAIGFEHHRRDQQEQRREGDPDRDGGGEDPTDDPDDAAPHGPMVRPRGRRSVRAAIKGLS